MADVKRVTDSGIRIIEMELNEYESNIQGAVKRKDAENEDALRYLKSGAVGLAMRLGVFCSCYPYQTSKRNYCKCSRQRRSKSKGTLSIGTLGKCRDTAGRFASCTGRRRKRR